jgi:hypothetical protein
VMPSCLYSIFIILFCFQAAAQKKWIGPVNGSWKDAQNWQPNGVPGMGDDVILDNATRKGAYLVALPDTTVNVHTLLIAPDAGAVIELVIPASNKSNPAFIITETGNSFNLKNGAVFRNASGLTSGESIQVNGIISIYNGGRYIHNSRSSHALQVVAKLSAASGTEKGIFEFDVPGGSYPISFSNRTYGTLILSSDASAGVQTYNASGTNVVTVNGDFQINTGVHFNLDLTRDMVIYADYIQNGGTFNIASQPNNNTVKIKGNIVQAVAAVITETSTGLPVIELCGEENQQVSFTGSLANSVTVMVNNPKGITLMSPLILPYKLQLTNGAIKTSQSSLLTLADNCIASGGSENSFVNGPMSKKGAGDFEFPVGKQGNYAPIKVTGPAGAVTDEFIAEYFIGDPGPAYGFQLENPPLIRISKLEYWLMERSKGSSSKKVSVTVGNFSDATNLQSLVVARWDGRLWKNEGNAIFSGVATGTLTSNEVNTFGAFTLGSIVEMQNPLPLRSINLEISALEPGKIRLAWRVSDTSIADVDHFEIEQSNDGIVYHLAGAINFIKGKSNYDYVATGMKNYFRLKVLFRTGLYITGQSLKADDKKDIGFSVKTFSSPVKGSGYIQILSGEDDVLTMIITDVVGRCVTTLKIMVTKGYNNVLYETGALANGIYFISLSNRGRSHSIVREFIKR